MGKHMRLIILFLWISLFFIFNKLGILSNDIDSLVELLDSFEEFKLPLFIILSTFRIITLIPGTIFMILGGIIFNPFVALAVSILCIVLSESIIYVVSKSLFGVKLERYLSKKYPTIHDLVKENNSQILFLGVLCPFTPTDAICSLSSSAGINYFKFIAIVAVANIPMVSLYSFLGGSLFHSSYNIIILTITIIIVTLYTFYLWKNAQYKHKAMKQ